MPIRAALLVLFLCFMPVVAGDAEQALWEAARQGDLATIQRLIGAGTDVNARTRYGATALAYACDKGHLEAARFLVEHGADVNTRDTFYEFSPIGWALFGEHVEIVRLLLENGASGGDDVLRTGLQKQNAALVALALKAPDISVDAVDQALAAAGEAEMPEAIVKLLEGAEIERPERAEIVVDAKLLESYSGAYRNDDLPLGLEVRVEEGQLVAQVTQQPALHLRPLSDVEFEAIESPEIKLSFDGRAGTIERAVVVQGRRTMIFSRVSSVAAADPAPEAPAAPLEPAAPAKPAASAEPLATAERTAARNWPSFRGPQASGIADGQGAPTEWDVAEGRNVLWKTPIPGLGNSSPIVWGNRVFVSTAVSGAADATFRTGLYGDVDSVDDLSEHTFKLYALDRRTGKILWERTAATAPPGAKRHLKSTQANSTPVTDGRRVVALFGTIGLLAVYDVKGKPQWTADLGVLSAGWFYDDSYEWGHASSPVIHDGLVIVQADIRKGSFIAAWRLKDGKQVWKTERDEIPTWGTPTVVKGEAGDELITNGTTIRAYDPKTGKELWRLGPNSEVTVATPVAAGDLVYVTAGYPPVRPVYAIKPGKRGDLSLPEGSESSEAVAWSKSRGGTYMPTPIVYRGQLYTCANNGIVTAYDARSGEQVYKARVGGGGSFTASPIAADGKLYFTNEDGDVIVVRAGATYEELATNAMDEVCMSTPAISDGVMVVRTLRHVYGLGDAAGRLTR